MEMQSVSSGAAGIPIPPPTVTIPTPVVSSNESPKTSAVLKPNNPEPSLKALLIEAEGLWKAGKDKRVELGAVLIQLHSMRAKRGNGTFQKTCLAIGIKKTTAYEYMKEANWPGSEKAKLSRRATKNAARSSAAHKRADRAPSWLTADEHQQKLLRKLAKDNPGALNRVFLEAIRVLEMFGEKSALAALSNSVHEFSNANSIARGYPV